MRLENDVFYCEDILDNPENIKLIQTFSSVKDTGLGLEQYLKYYSVNDEINHQARIYIVKDKVTNELVGYFSLKAGTVATQIRKTFLRLEMDTIPAIELANFAVNNNYKIAHKEISGIGQIIFVYFILPICKEASKYIGVNMLYIFALPYQGLIKYYESMHFTRLPKTAETFIHKYHKPRYDEGCIFMSRPLYVNR